MRICLISNADNVFTRRWIDPLLVRGDEVYLISYTASKIPLPGVAGLVDLTQIASGTKIRWLIWCLWMRSYLRKIQPEILHAHQIQASGWLAAISGYHPLVVSSWGSDLLLEPHRSIIRNRLVHTVLNSCDRLTVPSRIMHKTARELGVPEEKIRTIPWGVDTSIFYPNAADRIEIRHSLGLNPNTCMVLCPRGIAPLYNIDIVIAAVKKTIAHHPDLTLILLEYNVDERYLMRIKQLILDEGIVSHIHWLPEQKTAMDMARLYQASDLILSVPDSEGYGSSVYESMSCGCPTIISDLPVFDSELEHEVNTFKVPMRNIDATSTAIDRLLTDQALRQRIAQNGLAVARRHSIEERFSLTQKLYEELAS